MAKKAIYISYIYAFIFGEKSDKSNQRHITKTRLFKYTEHLTTKEWTFSDTKI